MTTASPRARRTRYALSSHRKAAAATAAGRFRAEILPVDDSRRRKAIRSSFDRDESIRADTIDGSARRTASRRSRRTAP